MRATTAMTARLVRFCLRVAAIAFTVACFGGCAQDFFGGKKPSQPVGNVQDPEESDAARDNPGGQKDSPGVSQNDVAIVLDGLQRMHNMDPKTRKTIQTSLDQMDPVLWPHVFRLYQSALKGSEGVAAHPSTATNQPKVLSEYGFPRTESARRRDGPNSPSQPPLADGVRQPRSSSVASARPWSGAVENPKVQDGSEEGTRSTFGARPTTHSPTWSVMPERTVVQANAVRPARSFFGPAKAAHRSGDWEQSLKETILVLEGKIRDVPQNDADQHLHAYLRVLYAVAGRREDAMRPIPGIQSVERDFWINEFQGLTAFLDSRHGSNLERRATEAARYFRVAASKAGELGLLEVNNLAFCTAIHSFGDVERFKKDVFSPGEEVLLYSEIENFSSESVNDGYRTILHARINILEGTRPVYSQELPDADETCKSQRRDFFVNFRFQLPKKLSQGEYTMQLTVEDTLARKMATRSIPFRIK